MRAIILVAGKGSRLPKKLSRYPKSFLTLQKKKIIEILYDNFKSCGIDKISFVTGYKNKKFNDLNLKFKEFHNAKWKNTNMVYSLKKAENWLSKYPCVVSYGDIFYEKKAVVNLLKEKSPIVISYDANWKKLWFKRFKNPLDDAETFKFNKKNFITEIGLKTKNIKNIKGQYMGLILFKPKGWLKFSKCLKKDFKNKYSQIYLTDVFQKLIQTGTKIKASKFNGYWSEVDTNKDYKVMNSIYENYQNNKIKLKK